MELFIFFAYPIMRTFGLTLNRRKAGTAAEATPSRRKSLLRQVIIALAFWLASILFLIRLNADTRILVLWSILALAGIALYGYGFHVVLPKSIDRNRPFRTYIAAMLVPLFIAILPIGFFGYMFTGDKADAFSIVLLNLTLLIIFTIPLTWFAFKRHLKQNEVLYDLEKNSINRPPASIFCGRRSTRIFCSIRSTRCTAWRCRIKANVPPTVFSCSAT